MSSKTNTDDIDSYADEVTDEFDYENEEEEIISEEELRDVWDEYV